MDGSARKSSVDTMVVVQCHADLLQMVDALRATSGFTGRLHCE